MEILFLGGDKRYLVIMDNLIKKGHSVDAIGFNVSKNINKSVNLLNINQLNISDYNVIVLPISGITKDNEIKTMDGLIKINPLEFYNCKDNCKIFTGLKNFEYLPIRKKNIYSFLDDPAVNKENNLITVKGIIDYLQNKDLSKVCILGYGNIGKILYDYLKINNIDVNVGVILENDYHAINSDDVFFTDDEEKLKEAFLNSTLIINTVPKNIITEDLLKITNAHILDIASKPFGVNQDIVKNNNYDYYLYSGIPSVYAPLQAGNILSKKLERELREGKR